MRQHADSDKVIAPADASVADEESIADESRRRQVSRRRLIKGAAAVGVGAGIGVAVWSSPSIRTLGQTPAYAATCTVPFTFFGSGRRNTDCGSCVNGLNYHTPVNFPAPNTNFEVAITTGLTTCSTPNQVPVTITTPGWDCLVDRVDVYRQSDNTLVTSSPSGVAALPVINNLTTGCGGLKWEVVLQCVPEGTNCDPPIP